MGSMVRLVIGAVPAVIVSILIFLAMYAMIRSTDEVKLDESRVVNIDIGRKIEDTADANRDKALERPQLDQPPPPPAISKADFEPEVEGVRAATPQFDTKVELGTGFNPDRDAQPLVRIPPR